MHVYACVCDLIGALRYKSLDCYVLPQLVMLHPYITMQFHHNKHLPRLNNIFVLGYCWQSTGCYSWGVCICDACMSWLVEAYRFFLIRTRWSCPCSPWAERCLLAKRRAGPLGLQRRDHLFGSLLAVAVLSSVMLFVWDQPSCRCDRMGKRGGGRWMMGSQTRPVLLRWQTGARAGGVWRAEWRERAGLEAGRGTNAHGRRRGSRFARGHNLQHLLAVIDQRKRREGNGMWSVTGWWRGLKSETPGKKGVCERIRGILGWRRIIQTEWREDERWGGKQSKAQWEREIGGE